MYWPQSVFGVLTASHWRWLEHAGWVIFEDVFLIGACLRVAVRELAFIQKPFTPTTLVRRVREVLDSMPAGMVGAPQARLG